MEQTIVALFYQRAKLHPEKLAILWNKRGEWQHILWKEYLRHVWNAAYGLLELGFKAGDRANIIGINRPEWFYSDLAILSNADIKVIQPHIMFAVPRVMEKFYAGIKGALSQTKGLKKKIIDFAINTGNQWVRHLESNPANFKPHIILRYKRKIADKLVYSKLKHELGFSRGRLLIAGGAPVPPEILRFFHSINIPLCVVYGQTEVTGPTSSYRINYLKP